MADEPETFTVPVENFGEFMVNRMKEYGDAEALVDTASNVTYTYADVVRRVRLLAAGLQKFGVKKGDVVAMVTPNCLEYPVALYATALIGGVFQPLSPLYMPDDILDACTNSSCKFIITLPDLLAKVKDTAETLKAKVIVIGESDGSTSLESLIDPNNVDFVTPELDPKTTTAVLFSSSGTTGKPKSVMVGHFGLIANIFQTYTANLVTAGERMILFLPMYHIYGLLTVTSGPLVYGAKLLVMSRFTPPSYLQLIQDHKATTLHLVPPVLVMFAKSPLVQQYDIGSIRTVYCGAAPLSPEVESAVKKLLKLPLISQGYAMTEIGVTFCNRVSRFKPGSAGQKLGQIEVKIVDTNTQEPLKTSKEGEIMIRGPQVALGYLNLPAETAAVFLPDGWVHTGDIGYQDDEGYLFIVDRLKELIKYKGLQVPPASLEDILLKHPAIADAAVIGVPNLEAGELPRAFVVKKPGSDATEEDIIAFVDGKVAPYMKLRGGVQFVTEIPKSPSGKILRRVLKAKLKESS